MTQQWKIRLSGKPRKQPDIALLVQAVLELAEQLTQERAERGDAPPEPRTASPESS